MLKATFSQGPDCSIVGFQCAIDSVSDLQAYAGQTAQLEQRPIMNDFIIVGANGFIMTLIGLLAAKGIDSLRDVSRL